MKTLEKYLTIYIDTELTFQKLEEACILPGKDVDYIAINPDWVCPTWYGFVPDCGSVSEVKSEFFENIREILEKRIFRMYNAVEL